jgi:hypothetical protein
MNKRKIAEEELKRALLLMKYDNRKTLTENKERILKEDVGTGTVAAGSALGGAALAGGGMAAASAVGGLGTMGAVAGTGVGATAMSLGTALGAGTAATALSVGAAVLGGAAAVAVLPLAYWLITKDDGADRVKAMIQVCSSQSQNIAKLEKKMSDSQYREMSDSIYDAVNGVGTDEEKLFGTFQQLNNGTAADACAMIARFQRDYGNLFEFLDDDIDAEDEWDQIYRPLRNCVEDSLLELQKKNPCKEGEVWDDKKQVCVPVSPTPVPKEEDKKEEKKKTEWRECEFPLVVGCKGDNVRKVQECLGISADGKFGRGTKKALSNAGYGEDVSKEDYDKIVAKCGGTTPTPSPTPTPYEVNPTTEPAKNQD